MSAETLDVDASTLTTNSSSAHMKSWREALLQSNRDRALDREVVEDVVSRLEFLEWVSAGTLDVRDSTSTIRGSETTKSRTAMELSCWATGKTRPWLRSATNAWVVGIELSSSSSSPKSDSSSESDPNAEQMRARVSTSAASVMRVGIERSSADAMAAGSSLWGGKKSQ